MPQYQGVWTLQQQMQALTSGQWATDPLFDYTTLLLQGDAGANGAQNNVFYDTSPNQFAITRNGNTTQGTFSPFSLQPGAWGNYFNGSTDYLTTPDAASMELGSGNFCVECWYYTTVNNTWQGIIAKRADNQGAPILLIQQNSDIKVYMSTAAGNFSVASGVIIGNAPTNQWIHVAVYRVGTVIYGAVNGVVTVINASTSATLYDNTSSWYIGYDPGGSPNLLFGYISNVRIVVGSAVYGSSNFIPPTSPLTAITNTQLLTCQANRFIDANTQTTAKTITANGTPSVQAFSPFAPQFQYTASVTGGSGYFDGTGDYLTVANNTALQVGSGDFTIEGWYYPTNSPAQADIFTKYVAGQQEWGIADSSSSLGFYAGTGGASWTLSPLTFGTVKVNQWNHFAVCRSGNTFSTFLNGTRGATTTNSFTIGATTVSVGIGSGNGFSGSFVNGYLSNYRIVKGTAVYDVSQTSITVPTAPFTNITNTSLLCNFTNAGILDGTMKNNLETVGNAQVSTSVVKYGSGSMYFDGTGDVLFSVYNPNLNLGSGDFTIEGWVYFSALPSNNYVTLASYGNSTSTQRWLFYYDTRTSQSSPGLRFSVINASNTLIVDVVGGGTTGWAANTWYHVAITRSGNSWKMFRDGTQNGSTVTDTDAIPDVTANGLVVGAEPDKSTAAFNGYLDDLRITKGIARYTQNFIPPSVALPRQ